MILPYLRRLGERCANGEVSVAHEQFASNLLRGRLLAPARGWDQGVGSHAVLTHSEPETLTRHHIAPPGINMDPHATRRMRAPISVPH